MSRALAHRSRSRGFTLLELLVVICIILILTAIVVPSFGPMMASYNLNRASGMVTDEFTFARQAALTQNADVEVRFDQLGTQSSPTDLQFRAFHTVLSATGSPLNKVSHLPDAIIISSNVAFSTLLDYTNALRSGLTMKQETLPGSSSPTTYVSFVFRATGGTGLSPVTPPVGIWDLALVVEKAPVVGTTGLPSNYVTIQIDPVEGQVRTFRP
jgi:uncharacterized protein (TIGR02596 family)